MSGKLRKIYRCYGMNAAVACSSLTLIICLALVCFASPARAEVTWTGDVVPADPATWISGTIGYIGKTGNGTMDITNGGAVSSSP